MKRILGVIMVVLAVMVGIVEFHAIINPAVAQDVARKFAEHDPFLRLPSDYHVIFILLFLGLLATGLHFVFTPRVHGTSRI